MNIFLESCIRFLFLIVGLILFLVGILGLVLPLIPGILTILLGGTLIFTSFLNHKKFRSKLKNMWK